MTRLLVRQTCLKCTCGSATSNLEVSCSVNAENNPVARATDAIPFVNIQPFGICSITQTPCTPATIQWSEACDSVLVSGVPVISEDSKLTCAVGGTIIAESAQKTVYSE